MDLDWAQLIPLIGPANAGLARYDGLLSVIPNAHILLSPLTTQEAVLSSKIEGTHVTIGEVLEIEAGGVSEALTHPKRDEAEEVINYRSAMLACIDDICMDEMKGQMFLQEILRGAHQILMRGVRGHGKKPGSYRTEPNFIGPAGCTLETANFIPIDPGHLRAGMDAWERYARSTDEPDVLVQLALTHLEFEALHPFKDGNGRLGRMLIPLFLCRRGLLRSPDFYMSGYLERNREEYHERLRGASRDGEWTQWCVFFLKGIQSQADENARRARAILALYDRLKEQVPKLTRSHHAMRIVDFLFEKPIFRAPVFINDAGIPKPSANRFLNLLREAGILSPLQEGRGRRAGIYAFTELLNVAEGN